VTAHTVVTSHELEQKDEQDFFPPSLGAGEIDSGTQAIRAALSTNSAQNVDSRQSRLPRDNRSRCFVKNEGLAHASKLNFNECLRSVIIVSVYKRITFEPETAIYPPSVGCGNHIILPHKLHDCAGAV